VDPDTQQLGQLTLQLVQSTEVCEALGPGLTEINQDVDVAVLTDTTSGYRSEQPRVGSSVSVNNLSDRLSPRANVLNRDRHVINFGLKTGGAGSFGCGFRYPRQAESYPPVMPFAAPHAQVPLTPPRVLEPHGVSPAAQSRM